MGPPIPKFLHVSFSNFPDAAASPPPTTQPLPRKNMALNCNTFSKCDTWKGYQKSLLFFCFGIYFFNIKRSGGRRKIGALHTLRREKEKAQAGSIRGKLENTHLYPSTSYFLHHDAIHRPVRHIDYATTRTADGQRERRVFLPSWVNRRPLGFPCRGNKDGMGRIGQSGLSTGTFSSLAFFFFGWMDGYDRSHGPFPLSLFLVYRVRIF